AAGRRTSSEAISTLRRPCSVRRLAILAVVVVLPEPCSPTIMIGTGGSALRSIGSPLVPSVWISWSCTSLTTSWPGVTDLISSTPTALALTCSVKACTTSSATSASSRARRTSRNAASTSASVSAPRRVSRSRMPPSRSDSESNISNTFNSGFRRSGLPVRRRKRVNQTTLTPEGASRCRAVASGLKDRSAIGHSRLCRERAERMGGARKSQETGQILSRIGCLREGKRCARLDALDLARLETGREGAAMDAKIWPVPVLAACLLFSVQVPTQVSAQAQDYPNRQVNFVVPFAPGG